MDLKEFGENLARIGLPLLGAALPLPGGAALGIALAGMVTGDVKATPETIVQTLSQNAAALQQAKQFELTNQTAVLKIMVDAEQAANAQAVQNAADINKTAQTEAAADHWPTYSWRPFIGFVFGVNLLIVSVVTAALYVCSMFGVAGAAAALPTLPSMVGALGTANAAALPILGVASWFRGKMQANPSIPTDNRG